MIWGILVSDSATRAPSIIPLVCMTLPPSKHRWVTTAMLLDPQLISSLNITMYSTTEDISLSSHRIVCGDRRGSLHVYQINFHTKVKVTLCSLYIAIAMVCLIIVVCTVDAITLWCTWYQWSDSHCTQE